MRILWEKVATIDLQIELHDDLSYRLRYRDLVEYANHRRRVGARTSVYAFRSVEQLRYDFEQDVLAAGGTLGEGA